jgi:quercetin dioxygenase-like cupin family protein
MSYSIVNLAAAEDRAAGAGLSDIQEARFPREALGAEQTGLALHRIHPGRRQAFGHRHHNAEEICVVLSGGGKVVLDGEVHDLVALDAVRIAPSVLRAFEAGPEGMELLVFGPHHDGDGEMVREDFWPENA